jgi:pSer/pThr/pTyr-binding forkhead associated (FHA) protein
VAAGSGAYQLIGDAVVAPASAPSGHDGSVAFAAPEFPADSFGGGAGWDDEWSESPLPPESDAGQPPQPAASSLVGGHLTLSSTSTSGSLDEGGQYEFELTGGDIIVGRSPGCDISLPDDPLASRRHAVLSFKQESGSYTISDLGSSNGTYLNGTEVNDETVLRDGDVISVGRHSLAVSASPGRAQALPIEARVTGPIAILPTEDTNPHLAAVEASTEPVDDMATAAAAPWATGAEIPWAADAAQVPASAGETLGEHDTSREEFAPPSAAPTLATPASLPAGGPHQHDLDALQTQLTELIGGLRQQAEADAAEQARLRRALTDVRDTLQTALATQLEPGAQAFTARVDALADLARKTAENPRHLDYVLSLSERAEELVIVLDAVQKLQVGGGPLSLLQGLYARVARELE